MTLIRQGSWVQVQRTLLEPSQRLASLPQDTQNVPMTMRVAGFLVTASAQLGDTVRIETPSGRHWEGVLISENPAPTHGFGPVVPELQRIGPELRRMLNGGDGS